MNTQYGRQFLVTSVRGLKIVVLNPACNAIQHTNRCFATASIPGSKSYLEVKSSTNKGLGAFATQDIAPFTQLLSDAGLMSLAPSEDLPQAFEQYTNFSTAQKTNFQQFHSFYNPDRDALLAQKLASREISPAAIPEMVKVSSIFTSNAFNVDDGRGNGTFKRVMFPMISRINHSCVPNAHTNYDPRSARMALYSISDISKGEEIEISYFNLLLPKEQRQIKAEKWGFCCTCPACEPGQSSEVNQHEALRAETRNIEQNLARAIASEATSPDELEHCILKAQEMVSLVSKDDSLRPQLPIAYEYVATFQAVYFQTTRDTSLKDEICENLDRAVAAEADITGSNSPSTEDRRKKKVFIMDLISSLA